MSCLVLEGVSICREGQAEPLFAPLNLSVPAGKVVTLMGPSGSGKSTLLDFVAGLLARGWLGRGRVLLAGRDLGGLPAERRRIGLLMQDAELFPHLSVGDNLAFGLSGAVRGRCARRAVVDEALAQAGLAGFHDRDPAGLSGGQRTRVALMRTLLSRPDALLLDEPFSRLDLRLRAEIRSFVLDHVQAAGIPTLMVTHDPEDAAAAGGPVVNIWPDG